MWRPGRRAARLRTQAAQRPWGRNVSGMFKGSEGQCAWAVECVKEREAVKARDATDRGAWRGKGRTAAFYACKEWLLFE